MAVKLLNIDCMEYMKGCEDNAFDLVITSPPYNLNKSASGGGSSNRDYIGWYPDEMPEQEYQAEQIKVVGELLRVSASVLYNHKVRYAWHSRNKYRVPSNIYHPFSWLSGFPIWEEIIWHRMGTSGHANGRCRMADERIYHIGKPKVSNDMGYTSVWSIQPTKNDAHVCSFPGQLVERCILAYSQEGDTIFDPYTGSGTTAIVCDKHNRNFVGTEIDKDYYDGAVKRFDAETAQLDIFA